MLVRFLRLCARFIDSCVVLLLCICGTDGRCICAAIVAARRVTTASAVAAFPVFSAAAALA